MGESARATALYALKDAKKVRCRNTRYRTRPDYWENIHLENVLDLAAVALRPVLLFAADPLQSHGFKRIIVLPYLVSQLPLPAVCRVNALTYELTGFVAGMTRGLYGDMASTFVGIVFADGEDVFLAVDPIAIAPQLRATGPHLQI